MVKHLNRIKALGYFDVTKSGGQPKANLLGASGRHDRPWARLLDIAGSRALLGGVKAAPLPFGDAITPRAHELSH